MTLEVEVLSSEYSGIKPMMEEKLELAKLMTGVEIFRISDSAYGELERLTEGKKNIVDFAMYSLFNKLAKDIRNIKLPYTVTKEDIKNMGISLQKVRRINRLKSEVIDVEFS